MGAEFHENLFICSDIDYLDTWKAMEKLIGLGLTKSIGVSNFNSEQLARLMANCTIKPIHNQVNIILTFFKYILFNIIIYII